MILLILILINKIELTFSTEKQTVALKLLSALSSGLLTSEDMGRHVLDAMEGFAAMDFQLKQAFLDQNSLQVHFVFAITHSE